MMRRAIAVGVTILIQAQAPTAPPDTEIFLAALSGTGGALTVARPVNISNSPGYDNQPSFTPDGRSVLFTSIRGGRQTDIYRYDIPTREIARITDTPESEYSPTVTPDRAHLSVIRVEADGTQRLWQFAADGMRPELVLKDVKPVGYHAWADRDTLVLFVLGSTEAGRRTPSTLQIADVRSGRAEVLARDVGRSIQPVPLRATISFVERETVDGSVRLHVRELDPKSRRITPLVDAPSAPPSPASAAAGQAGAPELDLAWAPDGLLLTARGDVLYGWRRADPSAGWVRIADLSALGLHGVSRLAVSPAGDRIAFVADAPSAPK
jgi:hypothetical protein